MPHLRKEKDQRLWIYMNESEPCLKTQNQIQHDTSVSQDTFEIIHNKFINYLFWEYIKYRRCWPFNRLRKLKLISFWIFVKCWLLSLSLLFCAHCYICTFYFHQQIKLLRKPKCKVVWKYYKKRSLIWNSSVVFQHQDIQTSVAKPIPTPLPKKIAIGSNLAWTKENRMTFFHVILL